MTIIQDKKTSIAVLPFVNRSADNSNEFFCDGITDEIINALSNIEQLSVTSRTSSFYFKNKNYSLQEISNQLNVSTILEGSVRFNGQQIRIHAQLIEVKNDHTFWSSTWDRKLENVFQIQDEISLLIAEKLREKYGHLEISEHLVKPVTNSIDAYQYCLKAKQLFNKWNPSSVNEAIELFEMALKIDDQLIEAHVGLADAYSFLAVAGFAPNQETWIKVNEHLMKAKLINAEYAPLNYLLANQAFFTAADFGKAAKYIQKSIISKPNHSEGQQFLSFLYILRGELDTANTLLQYVRSIDPLNQETMFYEAYFFYRSYQFDKAENSLQQLLDENAQNIPAIITMLYVLLKKGAYQQAEHLLNTTPNELIMPDERLGLQCLIQILKSNGEGELDSFRELESRAKKDTSFQAHAYLFLAYANLNQFDAAFKMMDKLYNNKSSVLLLTFSDPLADSIQADDQYLIYHARTYPPINASKINTTNNSSALNDSTSMQMLSTLKDFMQTEKPFLNPQLTLRSLANQINIHPNQLSWLLNEHLKQNYNEYINQYRVEEFKKLAVDSSNKHISLIGLAYESGFNSKTVFNTTFKKIVGMTPKEYQTKHSPLE